MTDPATPESNAYAAPAYGSSTGGAPAKSPVLSIISLITGILGVVSGFFGWGLLFSIAAVVLGHLGRKKEPTGAKFSLWGLITGYVGIAINVIALILIILATVAVLSDPNLVNQ
jgi:hypothetical protein